MSNDWQSSGHGIGVGHATGGGGAGHNAVVQSGHGSASGHAGQSGHGSASGHAGHSGHGVGGAPVGQGVASGHFLTQVPIINPTAAMTMIIATIITAITTLDIFCIYFAISCINYLFLYYL